MNLVIDFTEPDYYSVSDLQAFQDIDQITFIVPIFIFLQNHFKFLYEYAAYLANKPFIKAFINPILNQDQIHSLQTHGSVIVRGTFDQLHIGHQALLLKALYSTSRTLTIQVKNDDILHNKRIRELIQPIELRKQNIKKFLQGLKPDISVNIQTIFQPYGSAPLQKSFQALVISQQLSHSSKHINKVRQSNGLKKLAIIVSPLLAQKYQTKQSKIDTKISSHKVRQQLLLTNNMGLEQFFKYREIWEYLVREINSLCTKKDLDFIVAELWWERILFKHSKHVVNRKTNRQIFWSIHNQSQCKHQSVLKIAANLAKFFQGFESQQKSLQSVVKGFLDSLLKKKKQSKTCKRIKKMILNEIKQIINSQSDQLKPRNSEEQVKNLIATAQEQVDQEIVVLHDQDIITEEM